MASLRLATTALLTALALAGCSGGSSLTGPSGAGTRDTLGTRTPAPGDTTAAPGPIDTVAAGDPVNNGTWTSPGDSTPVIQPVDSTSFTPAGGGTAGSSGSSTALLFNTSGSAQYGIGTCGPDGYWTDPSGNVFGPHNPNCLAYGSDGSAGNNGKGQCVTSPEGLPGLWINPGGHPTNPYHAQCLHVGPTITTLALSFPAQAQLFEATDGSGDRALNFYAAGVPVAQLMYDGATATTTGAGMLVGTDNATPANTWTVYFGQPALTYLGGVANGDLISAMTSTGVQVVACNTAIGCSLVNLQLTLTP